MEKLLKTGPVVIRLRDFSSKNIWSLWQWKLEPFLTKESLISNIDISFNLSSEDKAIDILHNEKSGFYRRCVYSCHNSGLLHTLEDKEKAEKAVDMLEDFLKSIPVFLFECLNEKESADVLEKALEENL